MRTDDKKVDRAQIIKREILKYLSKDIQNVLLLIEEENLNSIEEIRIRANKPIMIQNYSGEWFVNSKGKLKKSILNRDLFIVKHDDILKTFLMLCENSIYAFQDEIINGFITIKGGHRIGISGRVILDGSSIKNIKDVSGLNVRISGEVPGCAGKILRHIIKENDVLNTMVISPPQCGKTTLLRDIARYLSEGISEMGFAGKKVAIVDERSEIAACFKGIAQNDVGIRTDVLDGCPKNLGMLMMIRAMSPQVIITDEIGSKGDCDALINVVNAGVKIITSAHGYSISDLKTRREVLKIMEQKLFERFIVLNNSKGPGTVEEIIDGKTMEVKFKK